MMNFLPVIKTLHAVSSLVSD